MEIEIKKGEKAVVVSLKGRMDAVTAPELEKKVGGLINEGANCFIINLGDLVYMSSAGLRVILVLAKKLKPGNGKLLISDLTGVVKEVFDVSGFATILQIYETEDEALKQI